MEEIVSYNMCIQCHGLYPLSFFHNDVKFAKCKKQTLQCYFCRNTKREYGKVYKPIHVAKNLYKQFQLENACIVCGLRNPDVIQADHRTDLGEKVRACSSSGWVGKEAELVDELKKCVAKCRNCHTQTSRNELWAKTNMSWNINRIYQRDRYHKIKKKQIVMNEKLCRKECCICKKKVTKANVFMFIFDHSINRHMKKYTISDGVNRNDSFEHAEPILFHEMFLCRLLCSNCDWLERKKEIAVEGEYDPVSESVTNFFLIN